MALILNLAVVRLYGELSESKDNVLSAVLVGRRTLLVNGLEREWVEARVDKFDIGCCRI